MFSSEHFACLTFKESELIDVISTGQYLFVDFIGADIVFGFDIIQFFLLLINVQPFECLIRLIVQHNQITITNVEARQMIARIFCIEYILIDNECSSPRFWRISTTESEEKIVIFLHLVNECQVDCIRSPSKPTGFGSEHQCGSHLSSLFMQHLYTHTLICRIAPYLPNISYISSDVILYGKLRMYRTRFTSGGRRIYAKQRIEKNKSYDNGMIFSEAASEMRVCSDVLTLFRFCIANDMVPNDLTFRSSDLN